MRVDNFVPFTELSNLFEKKKLIRCFRPNNFLVQWERGNQGKGGGFRNGEENYSPAFAVSPMDSCVLEKEKESE